MHLLEQILYDFRKDLVQNMNEIEKFFNKKNEQFARAITEISKEVRINNPLLYCWLLSDSFIVILLRSSFDNYN